MKSDGITNLLLVLIAALLGVVAYRLRPPEIHATAAVMPGRYQIVSSQGVVPLNVYVLDTATGQVWMRETKEVYGGEMKGFFEPK